MPDDFRDASLPSSENIRLLHDRVSVRKYTDQPVTDAEVQAILQAAYRAPTSSNIQAYSVVVVRDQATLDTLTEATGNQQHISQASVFLAFCADLTRIDHAMKQRGHDLDNNNLEVGLLGSIDASLVGMAAYLASDSLGIKGVMIGGVRTKPDVAARALGLPYRAYCVFGMSLGWPANAPKQKPRMTYETVTHHEKYDTTQLAAQMDGYDATLAEHYRATGRVTTDDSWTHDIDKKFHAPLREDLRQKLAEMGFDFG